MVMVALGVLVVEDEGLIAMALAEYLEDLGHHVVGPFATLPEAKAAELWAVEVSID